MRLHANVVTARTRQTVIDREEGCCSVCGRLVIGDYSLQHRRARGMGGSQLPDTNTPVNLVLVDGLATTGCHGRIESRPDWAKTFGYRVPQHCDPALTPVRIARVGWVFLTAEGGYEITNEPADQHDEPAPWVSA